MSKINFSPNHIYMENYDSILNLQQQSAQSKVWSNTLVCKLQPNKSGKIKLDWSAAAFASVPFVTASVSVLGTPLCVSHAFESISVSGGVFHLQNSDLMNEQSISVLVRAVQL